MALYSFEERRLDTSKIVSKAIKETFGDISPLTDLYYKVSKLNKVICEELEFQSLVWEAKIKKELENQKK